MTVQQKILTLDEFRNQETRSLPGATGELSNLLRDIALAAKRINVEVNKAGLFDILGNAGYNNVHGEEVKKLDEFANAELLTVLQRGVSCAGIVTEEMEDIVRFTDASNLGAKYICHFDPLDGSSNIDVNISIGTIFSIYKRVSRVGQPVSKIDFIQPGCCQVAAGYVIYGSSTMFVYATRRGVNGFTLDPAIGEFCLSHPNIKCPPIGNIYSLNYAYLDEYSEKARNYILNFKSRESPATTAPTLRYTGSLVADLHRNLLKGGIFLYPATTSHPGGKLRLVYECNPFAFIYEVAGGKAFNGNKRILEIQPRSLHERSELFAGSAAMIDSLLENY